MWKTALLGALALTIAACAHSGDVGAVAQAETCSDQTRAHNAELGRIVLEEVLGRGRIAENEHIYHPEFAAYSTRGDGARIASRAEDRAATEGWRRAAPDLRVDAVQIVADCQLVAVRFRARGSNTGSGNGLPATGRSLDVQGITFFRIRDGQIAEEWTVFDQYGMLEQLGMLPAAP